MTVSIDESYLIGGWLASSLWGVFSVLFCTSIYLMFTKRRADLYKPTTYLMILMYALATTHLFLALARAIEGLITQRDAPPGPLGYFANIGLPLNRGKDLIYITNMVIGDSIVVWRCYAVWSKHNWVVVLPILMTIGTAVSGYGAIWQYFLTNPSLDEAVAWGSAMFSVSLATNVLVTLLTAGRIWYIAIAHRLALGSDCGIRIYHTVVLLVIESGAVIAVAKIVEFTLFQLDIPDGTTGSHPLYIIFEMMPQITGIMPTVIIFVVNAGLTVENATYASTVHQTGILTSEGVSIYPSMRKNDGGLPGRDTVQTYMSSVVGNSHAFDHFSSAEFESGSNIPVKLIKAKRDIAKSSDHSVGSDLV